jgi:hypothetical protein
METRVYTGIIVGVAFGLIVLWGAMSPALPAGGLVLLAAIVDGILAGIGLGGLIGSIIAFCGVGEEETGVHAVSPELPKAA